MSGDKISVGDISGSQGIAIGRKAQASVQIQQAVSADELTHLFEPLFAQVGSEDKQVTAQITSLKSEVAKGEEADDGRMAGLIEDIASAAPATVEGIVNLFTNSVVAKIAGGATKYVLGRISQ